MHQAMLHAVSTSDARNKPKTCRAAPLRHARRAPLEHRAGASPRARFTRAPPTCGRITRADRAAHADMRHVLGLEDVLRLSRSTGSASGRRYRRAAQVCEVCEAAHLLPLHADVDLGATRGQRV
jgi:hypothetical protein